MDKGYKEKIAKASVKPRKPTVPTIGFLSYEVFEKGLTSKHPILFQLR